MVLVIFLCKYMCLVYASLSLLDIQDQMWITTIYFISSLVFKDYVRRSASKGNGFKLYNLINVYSCSYLSYPIYRRSQDNHYGKSAYFIPVSKPWPYYTDGNGIQTWPLYCLTICVTRVMSLAMRKLHLLLFKLLDCCQRI